MQQWLRQGALCYSAGTVGGLAKGGLILACERSSLTSAFADQLAQVLHPTSFYTRLVWAGVYGLLFLLPFVRGSWLMRGLVWALVVSLLQLVVFPLWQHGGLHILTLTTLSLLVLNCVWGLTTASMLRLIE
ncbi:MAG: hypothetical protein JWM78_3225 [Verrucomicrobiaceae bacterium]|nr:hypothetical protein [Verrucomicrobiaceae bacterium]